jgi:hypothetical protein
MRVRRLAAAALTAAVAGGAIAAQGPIDASPIQRMAATERAFAAAAAEIGWRDAFLTFFAGDAVSIQAGRDAATTAVVSARDGLRGLPLEPLPLAARLVWAPFTGHVSGDGSFGWLTGGFARVATATGDILGKGAYFSVWTRQPDGTWRVWLDEGIALPHVWEGASPFRAAPEPDAGSTGVAGESLDAVEQEVSAGGRAWRDRLAAGVRVHRAGVMPVVGREAAAEWSAGFWRRVRHTVIRTRAAASNDLAVALGAYDGDVIATGAEHGTWVRVWKRDVTDRWRLVFETSQPAR